MDSPPPTAPKSRTSSPGVKKPVKVASSSRSSSCASRSSQHSASPDPPAFTTIEFYCTPPPPPACPPAASPCKLLSSLNLFDLAEVRAQFKPLDSAINALTSSASYTRPDACYPTESQTLYSQALLQLRQFKQQTSRRHDSWHNTAFTSLVLQLAEVSTLSFCSLWAVK